MNYDRIFAFGCSFTNYWFPTWADILSIEHNPRKYYNFGAGGGGNLFISNRITQANNIFKFRETDLVMVMFSSFTREDRFENIWQLHGNVYNQDYYNKNFVKNYCDPDWFLIRDYGIIDMTTRYLDSLPCQTEYHLMGYPFLEANSVKVHVQDQLTKIYGDLVSTFKNIFLTDDVTLTGFKVNNGSDTYFDSHPSPLDHMKYLQRIGYPLKDSTIDKVHEFQQIVDSVPDMSKTEPLVKKKSHPLII